MYLVSEVQRAKLRPIYRFPVELFVACVVGLACMLLSTGLAYVFFEYTNVPPLVHAPKLTLDASAEEVVPSKNVVSENLIVHPLASYGSNNTDNVGLNVSASGAQTNIALHTIAGDNYFNTGGGSTYIGFASGTVNPATLSVDGTIHIVRSNEYMTCTIELDPLDDDAFVHHCEYTDEHVKKLKRRRHAGAHVLRTSDLLTGTLDTGSGQLSNFGVLRSAQEPTK